MTTDSYAESALPTVEPGIELPCYEGPDGRESALAFSNTELARSVVLLGSTGSGKTAALRSICRGLINQQAHSAARKPALIFFDFKGDNRTIELLTQWAKAAGRASDLRVLSLGGNLAYDFLGGFGGLGDVQEYVERLLFGCDPTNTKDGFWDAYRRGIIGTALTLSRVLSQPHDFPTWTASAASWLLADNMPQTATQAFNEFRTQVEAMPKESADRALAQFAVTTLDDWQGGLDHRTRSNVRATVSNALRPLLDPKTQRLCRSSALGYVNIADAINEGQIVVVSIPAILNPALAQGKPKGSCMNS